MWEFDIENIGGIQSGEAQLEPGLNVVQGSNFEGKSSFMASIRTVMGTTGMYEAVHPLTEGKDEGKVTLDTGVNTHSVTLKRESANMVSLIGEPYLTNERDRVCAELFAFMGEENPVRAAVRNQEDLTDYLQAPLDIEDIDAQIRDLKNERMDVKQDLKSAERSVEKVSSLEDEIESLEEELETLQDKRDELAAEVVDTPASDSVSDELGEKQGRLGTIENSIDREQSKLERKQATLDEKRGELEQLSIPEGPEVEADLDEKRERVNSISLKIDLLEDLYRANQQVIDENEIELVTAVERSIEEDTIDCWVCGNETTADTMEERLQSYRTQIKELRDERSSIQADVDAIEKERRKVEKQQRKKDRLEETVGDLTADIANLEAELDQSRKQRADLAEEVAELREEALEEEEDLNEELTNVKASISTTEATLDDTRGRLEQHREEAALVEDLEAESEELDQRIEEVRTRKREKQRQLKSEFSNALEDVIDTFAPGFDGGHLVLKTDSNDNVTELELNIARDGNSTTVDNLSEGERELIGIVTAIAGYRTFNVADRVPLILIDGVGQLTSGNLRNLVNYLSDSSEFLVTTAYPEAGDFGGRTISPTEWEVISDGEEIEV